MDTTIPPRARRRALVVVAAVMLGGITVLAAATTTTASTTEPPPSSEVAPVPTEPPASSETAPATEPPATEPPPTEPAATEPPPTEAPTTSVADVAPVEVLEEIPVVAAADDFGASDTDVMVFNPTYGDRTFLSATVRDDSASCNPITGGCDTPNGTVEFYVDGQLVGSDVLRPDTGGIGDPHRSFASLNPNPPIGLGRSPWWA